MFWDSSAVVPFLLPERRSAAIVALLKADPGIVLWWASPMECQSALYRQYHERALPLAALNEALRRLGGLLEAADFVTATSRVRDRAGRLLAAHPLGAGDALQLAAALVWCDEAPRGDTFVCLDEHLADAARREGFSVAPA